MSFTNIKYLLGTYFLCAGHCTSEKDERWGGADKNTTLFILKEVTMYFLENRKTNSTKKQGKMPTEKLFLFAIFCHLMKIIQLLELCNMKVIFTSKEKYKS